MLNVAQKKAQVCIWLVALSVTQPVISPAAVVLLNLLTKCVDDLCVFFIGLSVVVTAICMGGVAT